MGCEPEGFPAALAEAAQIEKGEELEWLVEVQPWERRYRKRVVLKERRIRVDWPAHPPSEAMRRSFRTRGSWGRDTQGCTP